MEFNNPALRLFNILKALKGSPGNSSTAVVLAKVFGVDEKPKNLFHAIGEFHQLVAEVIAFAKNSSLPSAPLLRHIPQIESAVNFTNLDAAWSGYVGRITSEALLVLEMVAHVGNVAQDQPATDSDIKDLESELNRLFKFISEGTDLDPEFRTFVLQQIEQIRRCLAEYRISGSQGFTRYLESFMIQSMRNSDAIVRQQAQAPEVVSLLKKVLIGVRKFVSFSEDGLKLLSNCKKIYSDAALLLEDVSSGEADIPEANTVDMN